MTHLTVVKVGGSLYDLPDLGQRLQAWLAGRKDGTVLIVPGGGPAADVVRDLDRLHGLGEERAHWLALRALSLNAHFLASLLPGAWVAESECAWENVRDSGRPAILDAYRFAQADEGRPGSLPHTWSATSDSLAARVAIVTGARSLVLLKSTPISPNSSWEEASRLALVDPLFARLVHAARDLQVSALDFRSKGASTNKFQV
jgi:aspartokinase-like uncharacterized kinase